MSQRFQPLVERNTVTEKSQKRQSTALITAGNVDDVKAMYEEYPYPSPIVGDSLIDDVANNLGFLWMNQDLEGKRILDAGCGSGHRLLGVAKRYPKARLWGLDMTSRSLDTARGLAQKHNLTNVQFVQGDLLNFQLDQEFDIIVSTGVIHHLENPRLGLSNVAALLAADGVFIVWHYHSLGEHSRLCDRELFLTLWGGVHSDRDAGLQLLKDLDLKLDTNRYGSSAAQKKGEVAEVNIDVDAYMHPIVNAYRFEEAIDMFDGCPVDWVAINGVNLAASSKLIDLSEAADVGLSFFNVKVDDLFKEESLKSRYRKLDKTSKLRVLELIVKPTGFTILGGRGAPSKLGPRIEGNAIKRA